MILNNKDLIKNNDFVFPYIFLYMLYFDFFNDYKLLKLLKVSHSNFCDSWFNFFFCYDKIQMITKSYK